MGDTPGDVDGEHCEGNAVEVKIGIQSVPRELIVETETPAEEIERNLSAALENGGGNSLFVLQLSKSGKVLIPADKVAYVEFGGPESRRVGFGNIV
jgi:Protein of unknown function (DUF3107)